MRNLREQVKKAFFYNILSDCHKSDEIYYLLNNNNKKNLLPKIVLTFEKLLEKIVLVISKILQILGLQPRISKVFLYQ